MTTMLDAVSFSTATEASVESGSGLHPLDLALARWMAEREPEQAEALSAVVLLLSLARREGHTALRLNGDHPHEWTDALAGGGITIPGYMELCDAIGRSRLVGNAEEDTPLVLEGDLLFFRRFHEGESRIRSAVMQRLRNAGAAVDVSLVEPTFSRLFNADSEGDVDWQAVAAAAALRSRLLCIAGGPGTGKTTTVTRILALLLQSDPSIRIALAAPTGKAANRMAESIAQQLKYLDVDFRIKEQIPTTAATLHRLLGYRPSQARFTYGEDRRLEADVVIVDEASMIGHDLFTSLLAALGDETQLILLGDPDQLPSIEAGFVFGDLCRWGEGAAKSPELTSFLKEIGLPVLPPVTTSASPMRDAVVMLTRSYRFGPDSGIGHLARALRDGRSDEAVSVLTQGAYDDLRIVSRGEQKRAVRRAIRALAETLTGAVSPRDALNALSLVRVLSPLRVGPDGVEALNEELEGWLLEEGVRRRGVHYQGKPVLVTNNDYDISLFNGDVGVLWEREQGVVGCFPDGDAIREIPLHRLPPHEVAWAMTIHKSQGSEFDDVLLILPDEEDADHLTRELLYTAVTRARRSATIIGDAEVFAAAAGRREERVTGLRNPPS